MGRGLGAGLVALVLLTACSGGGGSAANTTATTSTTTSTTAPTTTTTSPEDAVKTAYLDYWKMVDRVAESPDPNDPELAQRTVEPLLSTFRDNLSTQATQGRKFSVPPGRPNSHDVRTVTVAGATATLVECFIDGRTLTDPDGNVIDDAIVSKLGNAKLLNQAGAWLVSDVVFTERTPGAGGCGA